MPIPPPVPITSVPPLPVESRELLNRVQQARLHAMHAFPPGIAQLMDNELTLWIEISGRYGGHARMAQLAEEILAMPVKPRLRTAPAVAVNVEV